MTGVLPDCRRCGHPAQVHDDRAVAACITTDANPLRCTCPGYQPEQR